MTTQTPVKIEKLVIRVKRYNINEKLTRHIYFIDEYLENGDFENIGITNDFDSVLMITQPHRNLHIKIDYIIEETDKKEFYKLQTALMGLAEPTSTKYIFKGVNE